jgi:uncharacterized protein YjiS (DUF1127 family)
MTNIQCQALRPRHIDTPRIFASIVAEMLRLPWTLARTLARKLVDTLLTWQRRAAERDRLATLDPRLLADMGISEAAAAREAAIPFWRLK